MEKETLATVHCFMCARNRMRFGLKWDCNKCKDQKTKDAAEAIQKATSSPVKYTSYKVIKNDKKTSDK
jgi:ribosomal protein L37AE/L43A